jgi:hypothetical protein
VDYWSSASIEQRLPCREKRQQFWILAACGVDDTRRFEIAFAISMGR